MPSFFIAMDEKQLLVHYESQIEVLQMKVDELFKSSLEKDVINLNYKKSSGKYTSTIDGLTLKLQEFEAAQDTAISAVETRDALINDQKNKLESNTKQINSLNEQIDVLRNQTTVALKEYDEEHKNIILEKDSLIKKLKADSEDIESYIAEIEKLKKSSKDFEISNRNNIQEISKKDKEIELLKRKLNEITEIEVQSSRKASQLSDIKIQNEAKISELSQNNEKLMSEISKLKTTQKPRTTTRRRKSS